MSDSVKPTLPTDPSPHPDGVLGFFSDALEDIRAVRRADPAARSMTEIILTYPGLHALWMHRIAHKLYKRERIVTARLVSHVSRHYTGIEIHPGAQIGRRVFIDHGMGVVIGETAVIGDDCLIYRGVVLGGTSLNRCKRHPTLGKGVVVGSNACVLGAVNIGDGARVGSGSVVIKDVPENCTVVGIPGRVVAPRKTEASSTAEPDLNHAALPDPMQRTVKSLLKEIERLSNRLQILEANANLDPEALAEQLERSDEQDALDEELVDAYHNSDLRG